MGGSIHSKGDCTITARNIITRIEKLETSRRRPDEILLVWRKPNSDVAAAVATAKFAVGDRVIGAEWFGERPLPAPKWYRRMQSEMDRTEYEYVNRSLERLVAARQRERGFASVPSAPDRLLVEFSDNDLLHICLWVAP
jgi:hypothetical protein